MQKRFPIPDEANVEYVYDGLMHLGAEIALETIDQLIASDGNISSIAQEEFIGEGVELKSAPKIFKDTCCIDFHKPAKQVHDFIRGLSPYPGAWTYIKKKDAVKEQVLKIFKTTVSEDSRGMAPVGCFKRRRTFADKLVSTIGSISMSCSLQGKKRMEASAFLNGMKDIAYYECQKAPDSDAGLR